MSGVKIIRQVVPNDGKHGNFYRDGFHWLRENGIEKRYLDLAPNCEAKWTMEKVLCDELIEGLLYNQIEEIRTNKSDIEK